MSAVLLVAACQSVTNLDVKYNHADASDPAPAASTDGGVDDRVDAATPTILGEELQGCPCDWPAGLACCISSAGPPFCTTDKGRCDGERGRFFRCLGPDNEGSVCCLHRDSAETAYASDCTGENKVTVCTGDAECPSSGKCTMSTCQGGIAIGVCEGNPVCPPAP